MDKTRARIRFIASLVLYGTIGCMTRFIHLPAEVIVLVRGAVGALLVLVYRLVRGERPDAAAIRQNLGWLVTGGACLGLNWVFLFTAYEYTTVAIATVCDYLFPIIVIAVSPFVFQEHIGPKRIACVVLAFVGVGLISDVAGAIQGGVDLTGAGLGLAGAAVSAVIVISNKKMGEVDALDKVVVQLACAAAVALPYVLFKNGGTIPLGGADARTYVLLAVLVVVQTAFAYVLYFGSMGELPVLDVALLGYIEPVMSVVGSALFLHEPLGIVGALGAALVIAAAAAGELIQE